MATTCVRGWDSALCGRTTVSGILVTGPHRSGSSITAAMLEALGVDFNRPPAGWPVYDSNPEGQHGEDQEFIRLFNEAMGNWRLPILYTWKKDACDKLRALIATRECKLLWGIKAPRMCFIGGWMLQYMDKPKLVICARDLEATARSLHVREPVLMPLLAARYL